MTIAELKRKLEECCPYQCVERSDGTRWYQRSVDPYSCAECDNTLHALVAQIPEPTIGLVEFAGEVFKDAQQSTAEERKRFKMAVEGVTQDAQIPEPPEPLPDDVEECARHLLGEWSGYGEPFEAGR